MTYGRWPSLLVVTLAGQTVPGADSHPWWALVLIAVAALSRLAR